ncbi:MAG: hypothetical protein Q4B09_05445 [Lachnospiraceae bacterium]|nr:hypothetical protein [Lachnospiraceae bacterium]
MENPYVMRRGSTPVQVFNVGINLTDATVFVTYKQHGKVIVEKTGREITVTPGTITVPLTQEETLEFQAGPSHPAEVQIRYVKENGAADSSCIIPLRIEKILKEGVIKYVSGESD